MVGPDQLLAGQLVELLGEPLGEAPAVGEDDRAAMGPDELQDPRVDRRARCSCAPPGPRRVRRAAPRAGWPRRGGSCPRRARRPGARAACARRRRRSSPVERGPAAPVALGSRPPRKAATADSGRCVADRPMRCGGVRASASSRSSESARCAPRLVPASAWISSTMTHSTLRSASRACGRQQQVQRLRRRDEDVRRMLAEGAPLVGRRVAGAHADADVRRGRPCPWAASVMPASGARRLRSTSWTSALSGDTYSTRSARERIGRRRLGHQAVEAPQERGERLAAPGRRADERVLAGRDGRPALGLGRRRRLERAAEPRPRGGAEQLERVGRRRGLVAADGGSARGHGWRV